MTIRYHAILLKWLLRQGLLVTLGFVLYTSATSTWAGSTETIKTSPEELAAYQQAAAYSRAHRGISMLVMKDGQVVFEDYAGNHTSDEAHNLYSGTKSFSCAIAVAASEDKILDLDELVSRTIIEWQTDPQKSKITVRQLLSLTSGIDAGPPNRLSPSAWFSHAPTYASAINAALLHDPGTTFQYGAIPFQIFGELMTRKLTSTGENPHEYLERRVLSPIGLRISSWRTGRDGNPKMAAGMFLTAREWAKYGQLILNDGRWEDKNILNKKLLTECFSGTTANPGYGLTFWLPVNAGINDKGKSTSSAAAKLRKIQDLGSVIKAAGVGGQRLYIIPSQKLVIVRQASRLPLWGWGFEDAEFLALLFGHEG